MRYILPVLLWLALITGAPALNLLNLPSTPLVATGSGAGTATCSPACDGTTVTTTSLTTVAGGTAVLTINDTIISPSSVVLATVYNGSNSAGVPFISSIVPTFGSVAITITNSTTIVCSPSTGTCTATIGAFNGTLKVNFVVLN